MQAEASQKRYELDESMRVVDAATGKPVSLRLIVGSLNALEAERDRYREALERISDGPSGWSQRVAREALNGDTD